MSAGRDGFTLVEVLVAMTVASLALVAGFAALSFADDRSDRAEEVMVDALEASAVRDRIVDWLSAARAEMPGPLAERFQGIDPGVADVMGAELIFPTQARTSLDMPYTLVRLYIDRDPLTPERGLVAEMTAGLDLLPRRQELVPEAAALRIRYLPEIGMTGEWLTSWVSSDQLPRAVELTIIGQSPDALPPLLRYPIRVALETVE